MKVLLLLLFIFLGNQVYFGQQKKFVENVLDDFECRECLFIALDVVADNFNGKVVIENDDLYSYLEKTEGFDKIQYKSYVTSLLINKQALVLKNAVLDEKGYLIKVKNADELAFMVVKRFQEVDEIASKGCQTFIRYYFLGEQLKSIKESSMTCHEFIDSQKETLGLGVESRKGIVDFAMRNAIIYKLFEWQIAVGKQDITGDLVIERFP